MYVGGVAGEAAGATYGSSAFTKAIIRGGTAGAISGGANAMMMGGKVSRGILQGMAGGALTAAIAWKLTQSPAEEVVAKGIKGDNQPEETFAGAEHDILHGIDSGRFRFRTNITTGDSFPGDLEAEFLTTVESLEGDLPWGADETVNVYHNPEWIKENYPEAYAITRRNEFGRIEIIFGKMDTGGRFRSLVIEEAYHAADYTNGSLYRGMSDPTGWQGEDRAISYVLKNQSRIGFSAGRKTDLETNLSGYQSCLAGGTNTVCK
jgi:hypothetical protein